VILMAKWAIWIKGQEYLGPIELVNGDKDKANKIAKTYTEISNLPVYITKL